MERGLGKNPVSIGGASCKVRHMETTLVQANLPPELIARARSFVDEGWAGGFDELLADALRRFLESHASQVTETLVMEDVKWGRHGEG